MHPITIIGERIRYRMLEKGMNAMELARRSSVKPSFLYDIMNGKSANPSVVKLSQVAKELEVELEYILGEGAMEQPRRKAADGDDESYAAIQSLRVEASAGGGSVATAELTGEPYYFRKSWIRNTLHSRPEDLRIITIRGDSMEPTLHEGDVIMVDTSRKHPSPPGIFILFDGLGLVAKRIELITNSLPPSVSILSDNQRYGAYTRALSEIQIIGRVVWFAREL